MVKILTISLPSTTPTPNKKRIVPHNVPTNNPTARDILTVRDHSQKLQRSNVTVSFETKTSGRLLLSTIPSTEVKDRATEVKPVFFSLPVNEKVLLRELTLVIGNGGNTAPFCTVHAMYKRGDSDRHRTCIQLDLDLQVTKKNCRFTQVDFEVGFSDLDNGKPVTIKDFVPSIPPDLPPGEVTQTKTSTVNASVAASHTPGLNAGGSRGTGQQVNLIEPRFDVHGAHTPRDTIRWIVRESEKINSRGVRHQTLLLYMDVSLPVKARLSLCCHYTTWIRTRQHWNPEKVDEYLPVVFNLKDGMCSS